MIEAIIEEVKTWDNDDRGNKQKTLNILYSMLPEDNSHRYYLRYKGNYLNLSVDEGYHYGEECKQCYLSIGDTKPTYETWSTKSVVIAATIKYLGKQNEWMGDEEYPAHSYNPEDIEIIDNNGRVYNNKPYTMSTYAKIKDYINGNNKYTKELEWNYKPKNLNEVYCDSMLLRHLLCDIREQKMKIKVFGRKYNLCSLYDLYEERKRLVKKKGEAIRYNRTYKGIQNKLDMVNKKIQKLGGR